MSDKRILVILPGLMWCGVGIMLIQLCCYLVVTLSCKGAGLFYYASAFLQQCQFIISGFLRIVDKNLNRLAPADGKRSIFSFMTWKSYLIVLVMVSMGMTLRHSSIPKRYLSILYNGIGLGLFLSGIRYFRFFFMLIFNKEA